MSRSVAGSVGEASRGWVLGRRKAPRRPIAAESRGAYATKIRYRAVQLYRKAVYLILFYTDSTSTELNRFAMAVRTVRCVAASVADV